MRNRALFAFVMLSACASHDLVPVLIADSGPVDTAARDLAADLPLGTPDGRDGPLGTEAGSVDVAKDTPPLPPDGAATEAGQGEAGPAPPIDAAVAEAGGAVDGASVVDAAASEAAPPLLDAGRSEAVPALPAEFTSSPCKKEAAAARVAEGASRMVIESPAGLDGLECVAWAGAGSAQVALDLFNFPGACGAEWSGDGALAADGTLELSIVNPQCKIARCGICMFDWSFVVHAATPANRAVPVTIATNPCPSTSQAETTSATIGPESTGIRCTFADYGALAWHASAKSLCGKAGMPCVGSSLCGSGSPTSTGTCAAGLVCDGSAAANEPRCLSPCTTTADCPRADVWTCAAGLCRPKG